VKSLQVSSADRSGTGSNDRSSLLIDRNEETGLLKNLGFFEKERNRAKPFSFLCHFPIFWRIFLTFSAFSVSLYREAIRYSNMCRKQSGTDNFTVFWRKNNRARMQRHIGYGLCLRLNFICFALICNHSTAILLISADGGWSSNEFDPVDEEVSYFCSVTE